LTPVPTKYLKSILREDFLDKLTRDLEPVVFEREFQKLASSDPPKLIKWIEEGDLSVPQLTFAAEALSKVESDLACPCLFLLLTHSESLVREGAVYGLDGHLEYPGVRELLRTVAEYDIREGVRLAASEALR
jgi:hypothetical protein